jgi:hypothetical protein
MTALRKQRFLEANNKGRHLVAAFFSLLVS